LLGERRTSPRGNFQNVVKSSLLQGGGGGGNVVILVVGEEIKNSETDPGGGPKSIPQQEENVGSKKKSLGGGLSTPFSWHVGVLGVVGHTHPIKGGRERETSFKKKGFLVWKMFCGGRWVTGGGQ